MEPSQVLRGSVVDRAAALAVTALIGAGAVSFLSGRAVAAAAAAPRDADCAAAPTIVAAPEGGPVACDTTFVTTVIATSDCPMTYSWEIGPCSGTGGDTFPLADIPNLVAGSSTATLTLFPPAVSMFAGCPIRAVVSGGSLSTASEPFFITLTGALITQHPASVIVCPPQATSFTIVAEGTELEYQWFKKCPGSYKTPIVGATSPTLSSSAPPFWSPTADDCGCEVFCRVSKTGCSKTDSLPAKIGCCESVHPPTATSLWLSLDETAGSVAMNAASPFHAVALPTEGGPTILTNGYSRAARSFDGINDWMRVPNHPEIDVSTGDFTIDAWVKFEGPAFGTSMIVDKRVDHFHTGVHGYSLFVDDGHIGAAIGDGAQTSWHVAGAAGTVPIGSWAHIAVTLDRDSPTGVRLYVNGVLAGTFDPRSHPGSLSNASALAVGAASPAPARFFRGSIDEVSFARRALSAAEVAAIASAKSVGRSRHYCQPAEGSTFCSGSATAPVTVWVFNPTPVPMPISSASFTWATGEGCVGNVPSPLPPMPLGSAPTIGAWSRAPISVLAPKPSSMTGLHQVGCFEAIVAPKVGAAFDGVGVVVHRPDLLCGACAECETPIVLEPGVLGTIEMGVGIESSKGALVPYRVEARGHDSLPSPSLAINGMLPGQPLEGLLWIPGGYTEMLSIDFSFVLPQALGITSIILSTDLDGDGAFEPAARATALCEIPGPSPDVNHDGVVDGTDISIILGLWFTDGSDGTDLIIDGIVDGADLTVVLGSWGPVGP